MLKKYKNQLIEVIKACGLDPEMFAAQEKEYASRQYFEVSLLNSPLWFRTTTSGSSHHLFEFDWTRFDKTYSKSGTWLNEEAGSLFGCFRKWIENDIQDYLEELTLPDMWKQLEQQRSLMPSPELGKDDTAPFSEDEKTQLRLSIDEFRLLIESSFKPTHQELTLINRRLDYLVERLDKLPRVDWWSLALSTITSISIALTLDTEKGQVLVDLFKQVFSRVWLFVSQ